MRAFVTGGSGLLGGNLLAELSRRGHEVRAAKRSSSHIGHLAHLPVTWVDTELTDPASLTRAFEAADVVFHCAALVSIRNHVTSDLLRTNVEGTRNVLHSAVRASVGRVVYCSTVGTIGLSEDGNPCVEDMAWNAPALGLANGYLLSKRWAEDLVMTAAAAGVDAVVVNPTFMFGPLDSKPSSGRMIVEVASGRFLASTPGYNNFVDVRDVARGMILAAESGRAGERYILGGHDLTYHQAAEVIARVAGVRPPICTAPRLLARLVGWIGDSIEHLEPNLNSAAIAYAYTTRFRFSSDKARRELGYQAGPLEPAIADALRDFRARGLV